jgi:predicted transcriptional regulator
MDDWERLLYSVVNPNEQIGDVLAETIDNLNMSVMEFAEQSSISQSLLYKITSGHRANIQLHNFQRIVREVRGIDKGQTDGEWAVAVITNRESLETVHNRMTVDGTEVVLQEYPSSTVEEAIKQGIIAERDGVDAVICGPITAYTIENIVYVPVIGLNVDERQVADAVKRALEKSHNVTTD